MSPERRDLIVEHLEGKAEGLREETDGLPQFERQLLVHDSIVSGIGYELSEPHAHSILGPVFRHQGVCSGISHYATFMMNSVGVECATITGDAGGPHAWNLVRLDGRCYHMDVTWDMGRPGVPPTHAYLNLDDRTMSRTHSWDLPFEACCSEERYHARKGVMVTGSDDIEQQVARALRSRPSVLEVGIPPDLIDRYDPSRIVNTVLSEYGRIGVWTRLTHHVDEDAGCHVIRFAYR